MTDATVFPNPLPPTIAVAAAGAREAAGPAPARRRDPLGYRIGVAVLALLVIAATRGAFACELRSARTVAELLIALAAATLGAFGGLIALSAPSAGRSSPAGASGPPSGWAPRRRRPRG